MATGGGPALLPPGEYINVKVLNQLAGYIYPRRLTTLAIHLGFTDVEIEHITASKSEVKDQVLKIFCEWKDRNVIKVKDLVEEMVLWTQGKCIHRSVWNDYVAKRMDPSLMPDESTFDDPPPDSLKLPPETDTVQPHQPGVTYYVQQNIICTGQQMAQFISPGAPMNQMAITDGDTGDVPCGQEQAFDSFRHFAIQAAPSSGPSQPAPPTGGPTVVPAPFGGQPTDQPATHGSQITAPPAPSGGQSTAPPASPGGQFTVIPAAPRGQSSSQPAPPSGQFTVLPTAHGGESIEAPTSGQACEIINSQNEASHQNDAPPTSRSAQYYAPDDLRERTKDLQGRLYDSLQRQWKNAITLDWLAGGESFSTQEYYVGLRWTRTVKSMMQYKHEELETIYDILKIADSSAAPKYTNILIEAPPGMGKTCSMAKIALDWNPNKKAPPSGQPTAPPGGGTEEEIIYSQNEASHQNDASPTPQSSDVNNPVNKFDYVFLLKLRDVDESPSLPELIIKQHDKLRDDDQAFIQYILTDENKQRVLLLLDGYDEYTPGTNREIDKAIEHTVGNCFLILTSRPGSGDKTNIYVSDNIRKKMDGEVIIEGFDDESIKTASTKYLESAEKSAAMLEQAEEVGIYELLKVPIILLFVCLVYSEKGRLPKTRTQIYSEVFSKMVERDVLRTGRLEEEVLETLLAGLGELAWKALRSNIKQLLISKDELQEKDPNILKSSLLFEVGVERAFLTAQPTYMSFQHKSLQEFVAAKYITNSLKQARDKKEKLERFFPTHFVIKNQREVVAFWAGLEEDPEILKHFCVENFNSLDVSLLKSISRESGNKEFFKDLVQKILEQEPELDLSNRDMNGSLSEILPLDSPIQSLEALNLNQTQLNKSDAQYLGHIIGNQKLPALKHLGLWNSTLTGLLPKLLPDASLHSLEKLDLRQTELSESDVKHLGVLFRKNRFAKLQLLFLANITLTGLLPELLPPEAILPPLVSLSLWCTDINESDAQYFGDILRNKKLPTLKQLNLGYNPLTRRLIKLLPPDASLPSLEELYLGYTEFSQSDLQHLGSLIRDKTFPALMTVNLVEKSKRYLDSDLITLIETCLTYHPTMNLNLSKKYLSKEFQALWKNSYRGTNIDLVY